MLACKIWIQLDNLIMIYEYPFPMPYHVTTTIEPYNKQADFSHSHATSLRFSTFYLEKMTYSCHLSLTVPFFMVGLYYNHANQIFFPPRQILI